MRMKYPAEVTAVDDPLYLGRVKVKCPNLVRSDRELPFWIPPRVPFGSDGVGFFFVPPVGAQIEIEVTTRAPGDQQRGEGSLTAHGATYIAAFFNEAQAIPSEFRTHYPQRRGIKLPSGHLLMFDDTEGERTITIQDAEGNVLTLDSSGIAFTAATSSTTLTVTTGGNVEISGAMQIKLDGTVPVVRNGDPVTVEPGMLTWIAQVAAVCNGLVPGSVVPPTPPDFGKATATTVKTVSG